MHSQVPLCLFQLRRLLLAAALVLIAGTAFAQIRVTTSGGTDPALNDGSKWDKALSAAQLAARLSYTSKGGTMGEYWLAMGVYPNLMLHRGVMVYGGFAGTEQSRGERDPVKNQTTLSGLKFYTYEVRTADGQFVEYQNPDESVLVDGCKIFPNDDSTAVTVNFSTGVPYSGPPLINKCEVVGNLALLGAVNIGNGPLKFVDCTIRSSQGPGVFVGNTQGLLELVRCTVENNRGAGIQAITGSKIIVSNSTIKDNGRALYSGYGGESSGVRINDASANIRETLITGNYGGSGGGVNCFFPSTSNKRVLIRDSTVTGNKAFDSYQGTGGGGLYLSVYRPTSPDLVIVTNCIVTSNETTNRGGGFYVRGSGARILACTISTNLAWAEGGGLFTGISPNTDESGMARVSIQACVIAGNRSESHGGGIATIDTNPQLINCTLAHNSAKTNGGGLYNVWGRVKDPFASKTEWDPPAVFNCAFFGNQAAQGTVLLHSIGAFAGSITNAPPPPDLAGCAYNPDGTLLRYSQYAPLAPLPIPPGNYAVSDPGFADPAAANYHLVEGSPLIDKGTNYTGFGIIASDRDGISRPMVTAPDIGAYEANVQAYQPQVSMTLESGKLRLQITSGKLQVTDSLLNPNWQDVPDATNGIVVEPTGSQRFWRAVE